MNKTRGIYIDVSPKYGATKKYLRDLKRIGFTEFIPVLVSSRFFYIWSIDRLKQLISNAMSIDCEVVGSYWPMDDIEKQKYLVEYLGKVSELGVVALEADLEHNHSIYNRWPYLRSELRRISLKNDVRIEMTTLPYHDELSEHGTFWPHCHRVSVQAHSVAKRAKKNISFHSDLGPGKFQKIAVQRAKKAGIKKMTVCLPLFSQKFHDYPFEEASLKIAYETALTHKEVTGVRYWSSKHIQPTKVRSQPIRKVIKKVFDESPL